MKLSARIAHLILPSLYKLWAATLRYEEIGKNRLEEISASGGSFVLCGWHHDIFSVLYNVRKLKMVAVVSKSKDGEFLARVADKLGFHLARGSSSKGGAEALRAAVKAMRKGYSPCITMDGPRGPRHEIKDGVFYLARLGNGWIAPVRAFYTRGKRFNSWDRFILPFPFSRVRVVYGEPYRLEATQLEAQFLDAERGKLKVSMDALESYASEGYRQ